MLHEIKQGAKFVQLAFKHSRGPTAARGGMLPPIGAKSVNVSPAIKQAALAMTEVSEVSEIIQANNAFHILKLERILNAGQVSFAGVKEQLAQRLGERLVRQEQDKILTQLTADGRIKYVHPILKAKAAKGKGSDRTVEH